MSLPPVETLAVVDSTNAEAKRRAMSGQRGPLWLRAETQSAGVGRSGRQWHSPPGNLYATLLMPWAGEMRDAALMSFVACLAVADTLDVFLSDSVSVTGPLSRLRERATDSQPETAVAAETPPSSNPLTQGGEGLKAAPRVTLKWPNDALLDGKKVAGVLLEAGPGWLAIGIGINLASKPTETRWPPIAIADVTDPPTPDAALTTLAQAFETRQRQFETHGFAPIRTAWLARAARLGQLIEARLANAAHKGIFNGIAEDGALLLGTREGERRIAAADIYFPG